MSLAPESSTKNKKSNQLYKNLYKSFKIVYNLDKSFLFKYFTLSLLANSLPFVTSWYTAVFINKIVENNFSTLFDPALIMVVILYVTLPFFEEISNTFRSGTKHRFQLHFIDKMDREYMATKGRVDIETCEDPEFNDLMIKVQENSYRLTSFTEWVFELFAYAVRLILSISIIAVYVWWAALLLLLSMIPDMFIERRFGKKTWGIWDAQANVKRRYNELSGHFVGASSLTEMKVSGTGVHFLQSLKALSYSFIGEQAKNISTRLKYKTYSTLLVYTAFAIVIMSVMHDVIVGTVAVGTFVFIMSSMSGLQSNLSSFFRGVSALLAENLFVTDIHRFLETPNVMKNGTIALPSGTPGIEFEGVRFAYPHGSKDKVDSTRDTREIFHGLTCTIRPGEKIAIVGVNGAGKSTFTKLLMRFYDPNEGVIYIGGHNMKDVDIQTYYKKIGYLSQQYDKYKMDVKEAIATGDISIPVHLDRVIDAARRSGASEFIEKWPAGYDTQLGKEFDGGIEPSIGQWQKIALARLFYKNPEIWILDEPTASIDAVAEMEIFQELENLPKDKTVILISHRFNTVKNADKIMVIEHGEIKEFDSHSELMKKPEGIYARLFTSQKQSFEDQV